MKGRFLGLLGALSVLLSDGLGGAATPTRTRAKKSLTNVDKAHQRAAERKATLDHLARIDSWGGHLSHTERADLRTLRLTRGKLARRMGRQRNRSINKRLRAAADRRVARTARERRERAS